MLLKAANSYSTLCTYRFLFGLGKREVYRKVEISFPESAFHHLAGFQYVTRNPKFVSKSKALNNVKTKIICEQDFDQVHNLEQIRNRWSTIGLIEEAIHRCRFMLEYVQHQGPSGSRIKATYLIAHNHEDNVHYFFFDGKKDDEIVPVSCLLENKRRYDQGCVKWTVLRIERSRTDGSGIETIFCHERLKADTIELQQQ